VSSERSVIGDLVLYSNRAVGGGVTIVTLVTKGLILKRVKSFRQFITFTYTGLIK